MVKEAQEDNKHLSDNRFKGITTSPVSPRFDPDSKKRERSKNTEINIQIKNVKKKPNAISILKTYYEEWEKNN
jgi:hypothetical protein